MFRVISYVGKRSGPGPYLIPIVRGKLVAAITLQAMGFGGVWKLSAFDRFRFCLARQLRSTAGRPDLISGVTKYRYKTDDQTDHDPRSVLTVNLAHRTYHPEEI